MESKIFQVKGGGFSHVVVATLLDTDDEYEKGLLREAGFETPEVLVADITGGHIRAEYDPFRWGDRSKPLRRFHEMRQLMFTLFRSGAILDMDELGGSNV